MNAMISLRLPEPLARRISLVAKKSGLKRSELIRRLLERDLEAGGRVDHPYARVADLIGSLTGEAPSDLGKHHGYYLRQIFARK